MKVFKKEIYFGLLVLVILLYITIFVYDRVLDIEKPFQKNSQSNKNLKTNLIKKDTVFIGVVSRYPPPIIYQVYQPLMDFMSENTDYRFELKLSTSYNETVEQLINHIVDAAFLGSYVYVDAHDKYGIRCILKPLNENFEPYFHSVIITKNDSHINSVEDLKGKKVALPSQQSFSSKWFIFYELKMHNISLDELKSVQYFSHHQTVVSQVLKGNYDAGVVREQVAKDFIKYGIRIFARSYPIPGSPLVVPKDFNPEVTEAIKNVLLNLNAKNDNDKKIMESLDREFAYGFVEATDSDYQHIRELMKGSIKK